MKLIVSLLLVCFLFSCQNGKKTKEEIYQPTWESLSKHNAAPEWFRDAKFGIYFHWGVYTVPAYGFEWYPRLMHLENDKYFGSDIYNYHLKTYGHPSEFGYHDFVPMFKAEQFDPDEWAQLFKEAGAKFAGPVAEHSDGFAMWDSEVTPWNAMDKGPKRDIVGELAVAIKKQKLPFITSFHNGVNLQRYKDKPEEKDFRFSYYAYIKGMPPTSDDPELKYLYGNIPEPQWLEEVWMGKLTEVIQKYDPDILWFDSGLDLIPENYRQEMSAFYLNHAKETGKEVVIVRKQEDLPLDMSVNDLEKSRMNRMGDQAWMTDETISTGSWCYTQNLEIKPAKDLIHVLIDIVSKNGVLLLNISPKSDGTIPENQKSVLLEMGDWLSSNGEAIYNTRPWFTFGEGPTQQPEGDFKNHSDFKHIKYSEKDIRYTCNGNSIYAITLGNPSALKKINLKAFAEANFDHKIAVKSVHLLGCDKTIDFELRGNGLWIILPETFDQDIAAVFKIVMEE